MAGDVLIELTKSASWKLVVGVVLVMCGVMGVVYAAGAAEHRLTNVEVVGAKHEERIKALEDAHVFDSWNLYVLCHDKSGGDDCAKPPAPK
jgi:hypothetical protein